MGTTIWGMGGLLVLAATISVNASEPQHSSRAALVVQSDGHTASNNIYEGTVRWDSSNADDRELGVQVVAKIGIPHLDGDMKAVFRANHDKTQPYVLTIDVDFPQNGVFRKTIERIGMLEGRADSQNTGSMLAGNVLTTGDKFSIGVTEGDVNTNNFDLLLNDNWFEIPIQLKSGKESKITFEKGIFGRKQIVKLVESLKAPAP